MLKRWLMLAVLAAAAAGASQPYAAGLDGHDPVTYLTRNEGVKGSNAITAVHGGETYYFASTANRDAFIADPGRYLPQYGGYCAWAVAQGQLAPGNPTVFKVVDNKLYFNVNREIAARWEKDIPGFIRAGDANWPRLKK